MCPITISAALIKGLHRIARLDWNQHLTEEQFTIGKYWEASFETITGWLHRLRLVLEHYGADTGCLVIVSGHNLQRIDPLLPATGDSQLLSPIFCGIATAVSLTFDT